MRNPQPLSVPSREAYNSKSSRGAPQAPSRRPTTRGCGRREENRRLPPHLTSPHPPQCRWAHLRSSGRRQLRPAALHRRGDAVPPSRCHRAAAVRRRSLSPPRARRVRGGRVLPLHPGPRGSLRGGGAGSPQAAASHHLERRRAPQPGSCPQPWRGGSPSTFPQFETRPRK